MTEIFVLEEHTKIEQDVDSLFTAVKSVIKQRRYIPTATYRIQFNRYFTFEQACEQVAYLKRLGISDLYASPYFRAKADSLHGYDTVNHNELNPATGTLEDYNRMVEELHWHGLHQILDTVPNHMGIGETGNAWWMDVLENGPASLYADYFDIDWQPLNPKLTNRVLLPVLGNQYGQVLENKELQLRFNAQDGTFQLDYYDRCFPISPRSYSRILEPNLADLLAELGPEAEPVLEYQSIITAISHLPFKHETEPVRRLERNREKEVIKRRLAALCLIEPRIRAFIERNIEFLNGVQGHPESFNMLDNLLERQAYRLSFWRVAAEEINYRRFFDVNELAAVRVDQPAVFDEIHRTILKFLREGKLDGLRIDHVDGLRNPAGYFSNLQRAYFLELCRAQMDERNIAPEQRSELEAALLQRFAAEREIQRGLYLVVEKILGRGENLPTEWLVNGTTGYEFTNAVNGLFVNSANAKAFDQLYTTFIDNDVKFADLVYDKKKQIMRLSLASEITVLTNLLSRISESDRHYRDFTINSLRTAIRETIACFPVYRTYLTRQNEEVSKAAQVYIQTAIARAKKRNPALDLSVFDFLADVLLLKCPTTISEADCTARYNFVMKFQQCSGPVIAKGLEDTAFYVYNRLISLNEVGGEPEHFGLGLAQFHRQQAERQRQWPGSMLTTSTHDTKRSEDVRARISVLSELPVEWKRALTRWTRWNAKKKPLVDGQAAPDRNEEIMLYQTLLGVWPFGGEHLPDDQYRVLVERVQAYMRKAMNEAKVNTSWVNPNEAYQTAVANFIAAILERSHTNKFLADFGAFQQPIADFGAINSLAQTLIKLTSPGVPDIYQGTELWDFSLVDPDNRRPVDYDLRNHLLNEVERVASPAEVAELLANKMDGRIKLLVTSRTLNYRLNHVELFQQGDYVAVEAQGPRHDNICAFTRNFENQSVVTVVARLLASLKGKPDWTGTWLILPNATVGQQYRNIFTDEVLETSEHNGVVGVALEKIFAACPVALLARI